MRVTADRELRSGRLVSGLVCLAAALAIIGFLTWLPGCSAGAQTELTAADALVEVANVIDAGIVEYHGEVATQDKGRRDAVLDALAARIAADPANAAADTAAAKAALDRVAADGEVENARLTNLQSATGVLREMATRLRELALERLAMTDQARRVVGPYVTGAGGTADEPAPTPGPGP
jgi:hypothetical protein